MSITSSLLLFLLLLRISLHACHARRLSETQEAQKKNDQVANRHARAPAIAKLKPATFSNKLLGERTKGETVVQPILEDDKDGDNAISSKTKKEKGQAGGTSTVAISWHMRHKGRGEQQQPGFDLDYLPPKTHPPVHN